MKQESAFTGGLADAIKGIDGIDFEYVDSIMDGDAELFRQLLQIAEKMLPDSIRKLNAFLAQGNLAGFNIEVHGLKGSLNSIGAQELGRDAFELEKASRNGDLPFCRENIAAFTGKLETFHRAMADALGRDTPGNKEEGDVAPLVEKLMAAEKAAERLDNASAFSIVKNLMRHSYGIEIDSALKEVENSLDEFECDTAACQLQVLIAAVRKKSE